MKFELKNFHFYPSFSEETNAYTATVYVDGTRAFEAKNDGHGGPDDYRPLNAKGRELLAQAEAWAAAQPPLDDEQVGSLTMNLELYIGLMVEDKIRKDEEKRAERQLRNWCKDRIVFRTPDLPEGEYRTFNMTYTPDKKSMVLKKYPDAEIINERFLTA